MTSNRDGPTDLARYSASGGSWNIEPFFWQRLVAFFRAKIFAHESGKTEYAVHARLAGEGGHG
jgi:hypothetical protein